MEEFWRQPLSSNEEDRELFQNMLNDCYEYAAVVNAKGEPFPAEPLTMALLLLSQHKMIDWLTESISKHESHDNNKVVKRSKEEKQELGREK